MKAKRDSSDPDRTTRRQFAKAVAETLIAAPLAAQLAKAQTPTTKPKEPTAPPNPQQTPAPQAPSPLAEAYAEVARQRFGAHLTPEQLEQVKKAMTGIVAASDSLQKVKLKNGDEPDFVFDAG